MRKIEVPVERKLLLNLLVRSYRRMVITLVLLYRCDVHEVLRKIISINLSPYVVVVLIAIHLQYGTRRHISILNVSEICLIIERLLV